MLEEIIEEVKDSMEKGIESLRRNLGGIRTGRVLRQSNAIEPDGEYQCA